MSKLTEQDIARIYAEKNWRCFEPDVARGMVIAEASWNACITHLQTEEGVKESIDSIIKREREQALKDDRQQMADWLESHIGLVGQSEDPSPCHYLTIRAVDMESLKQGRVP